MAGKKYIGKNVEYEKLELIKRLAIIAMFSDDELMDILVLKGGNALDIVYKVANRASLDLDFSIESEFKLNEVDAIKAKMEKSLIKLFKENGYVVFDVEFRNRPRIAEPKAPPFWGGYELEFKIIEKVKYGKNGRDLQAIRLGAVDIGPGSRKTFRVEISKWEDCKEKQESEIDNYTIYVYSPEMIVIEKLRAICQQMPEYDKFIGKSYSTARARDFFDIHTAMEHFNIDLTTEKNVVLLKNIFKAKKVPLRLIGKIKDYREFHRPDFISVETTVKPSYKLKEFDYYFDYVLSKCDILLETLGIK